MNNYFSRKDQLKECAKKHHELVNNKYSYEVKKSIKNTIVYNYDFKIDKFEPRYDFTLLSFCSLTTTEVIFQYANNKNIDENRICALNFASYKNPGGMYMNGSSAQEECLCHSSTLYEVLSYFNNSFYSYNKRNLNNALYTNRLLYSKDILFFNDEKNVECDIITCAAPNKTAAKKYKNIDDDTITRTLIERIFFILQAAYNQNVNTIILGAYGTGVFGNDIKLVSCIFKVMIDEIFHHCFNRIIYAIPVLHHEDKTMALFYDAMSHDHETNNYIYNIITNMYNF